MCELTFFEVKTNDFLWAVFQCTKICDFAAVRISKKIK